jgi:hypothetical protein
LAIVPGGANTVAPETKFHEVFGAAGIIGFSIGEIVEL